MRTSGTEGSTEPSREDLLAIEREWPLIEAEMALVVAEIHVLTTDQPCELDWRRVRRAEARVAREALAFAAQTDSPVDFGGVA